jgi:hypothetical protein
VPAVPAGGAGDARLRAIPSRAVLLDALFPLRRLAARVLCCGDKSQIARTLSPFPVSAPI